MSGTATLKECWKEKKDPWRTGVCSGGLCGHWAGWGLQADQLTLTKTSAN